MKQLWKALVIGALCVALSALCLACAEEAEAALYDETVGGWHIAVEKVMVRQSMKNVTVDLGYTDVETTEFVKEAPEGKLLCLVKLNIEKAGSREKIAWENMLLTDAQGRQYNRIEDNFISDLGMKHMPGTPLNFGVNEGWIAYEIDADAETLTLSYDFAEEAFSCAFPVEAE